MFAKLIVHITKRNCKIRKIKVSQKFHVIRYCWERGVLICALLYTYCNKRTKSYVINFQMQMRSSQSEECMMFFTHYTPNQNDGKQCFFTCEKTGTSNQKPQKCRSFMPNFLPFIGTCSFQHPHLLCCFADIIVFVEYPVCMIFVAILVAFVKRCLFLSAFLVIYNRVSIFLFQ